MDTSETIQTLIELLRQQGIEVRYEKGNFRGGYCKVGAQAFVILNRRHPPEIHLSLLAQALAHHVPINKLYLRPALRSYIESFCTHGTAS